MVAGLKELATIAAGGLLMTLITLVGGLTALLAPRRQQQLLLPLIALAAGSLMGGALFHMLPMGLQLHAGRWSGVWLAAGFTAFLALEQGLKCSPARHHRAVAAHPVAVLILLGDGLHNFIGGLGIASTFLLNPAAGVAAWLAALAHELPQELGDFGVLVHCGWSRRRALTWNFIAGLSFPLGGLLAWLWAGALPLPALVLFAAGNFLYIAASDLVPEIKARASPAESGLGFIWFLIGLGLMLLLSGAEP